MSSGQWEVVGRNKKDKMTNKKPNKLDKKKIAPAPKVEDILPLSQVKSIYSNMGKSNNKENKKPQEKENKQKVVAKKQQPAKKSEKPQEASKPKPLKSIESALNLLNVNDFKSILETNKQKFPEAPLVWLKELSAYLNSKLTVELNDPVFTTKPDGYPFSLVPTGMKHVMEKAIHDAGKPSTQIFFDISLTAMTNDMSKGLPSIGHKIWLQFLALNNPQLTTTHLEKHVSLRTSYHNRQPIGLSILWALGQGGIKDFHVGLKVFKDYMLPLLEMRNYSRFIVRYLAQLLGRFDHVVLSRDTFVFLFDFIHTKHSIPNEPAQELNGLSKKLKILTLGKNADKKCSPFFEPLFNKMVGSANTALKNEISDLLATCLVKDAACYNIWRQMYAKHLEQSYILLKYISNNWNKLSKQLDKKQIKQLLTAFSSLNMELVKKSKKDAHLNDLITLCKTLLDKMTVTKSFPWKFISFIVILSTAALLAYDFNKHGSWKKTQSVRTLKDIGVWEYGEKAWDSANHGFNWTKQRIEEYAPGYIDATGEVLHPYLELARDLGLVLYNIGEKIAQNIIAKAPLIVKSVEKYAPGLLEQVGEAWKIISAASVEYWNKGYKYLTTEVFVGQLSPENIQKVFVDTFDKTLRYSIEYYNWACEKVQSIIQGN